MDRRRHAHTRAAAALLLTLSAGACIAPPPTPRPIGDAAHGRQLLATYGCGSCHEIPGVAGADGMAGPPLDHFARRTIIGGYLPNTPPNLVHWIEAPQTVAPGNAMPDLGVADPDARDMAAYLGAQR